MCRRSLRWWPLAATSAVLLAWSNLVVPALPPSATVRATANMAATVALVAGARMAGIRFAALGLSRSTWRAGVRWGGAALAVATVGYLVALVVPAGREALADSRLADLAATELAVRGLVLIPLGTVLFEELAFRGVLLALASRYLPARAAVACTSVVFGLWHISTALNSVPAGHGPFLAGASVAGTVIVTGLGGVLFAWLRLRSGSLLASIGLHLGSNSIGLLAAAAA